MIGNDFWKYFLHSQKAHTRCLKKREEMLLSCFNSCSTPSYTCWSLPLARFTEGDQSKELTAITGLPRWASPHPACPTLPSRPGIAIQCHSCHSIPFVAIPPCHTNFVHPTDQPVAILSFQDIGRVQMMYDTYMSQIICQTCNIFQHLHI